MSSYNSGTGLDLINYTTSNIDFLLYQDSNLQTNFYLLSNAVSNLNPVNVDSQILALQNKDISIDSNISILYSGYSNNSNSIAQILINGGGGGSGNNSNYDAQLLALSNQDTLLSNNILALQTKENIDIGFLNVGVSNNSNVISALKTKENIDIGFLNVGISNNILAISALSVSSSNFANTSSITSLNSNLSTVSNNVATNNTTTLASFVNINTSLSNLSTSSSNYALQTSITSINTSLTTNSNNILANSNSINSLTIKETNDILSVNQGYSNNSNLIHANALLINTNTSSINYLNLYTTNTNTDVQALSVYTSNLCLASKEANDVINLNAGLSNLSILSSNFSSNNTNIAGDVLNLNKGLSNLSLNSSNYALTTNLISLSNATSNQVLKESIDVLFLNTGYSNNLGLINTTITNVSTNTTNIANQVSKEALDVSFLNTGYSNNLISINNNITNISTNTTNIANQVSKEALDVSFINTGYSNNLGLINTNTTNIANQISKEALDVSFLNTGYSNNFGLINTNITSLTSLSNSLSNQIVKEALDVSFLNVGYSNNSNAISTINTNISSIPTLSNSLSNQIVKEAIDVSILNIGYSNNLASINTNTTNVSTNTTNIANQVSKEALDVSFLNTGYSNNLGLINTANTNIATNAINISNQVSKEALDISFLNTGYSNNLTTITTNTTSITNNTTSITANSNALSNQIALEKLDISSLNVTISNNITTINTNTSAITTNATNITNLTNKEATDSNNLCAGISNLSALSSNYATATNTLTFQNKTIDFSLNTILNNNVVSGGVQYISKSGLINITSSSTISYNHGLATTPTVIRFDATFQNSSSAIFSSSGTYTTATNLNYSVGQQFANASTSSYSATQDSTKCISASGFTGYVSAISSTTFTIVWVIPTSNSPTNPNYNILWTAEGGQAGGAGSNNPNAIETFTNKIMSFSSNIFTNFPYCLATTETGDIINLNSGVSNLSTLSSNYALSSVLTALSSKEATDSNNLNAGISNLSALSSNYALASVLTALSSKEATDSNNLNSGISNLSTLSSNYALASVLNALSSKEATDSNNLCAGISNLSTLSSNYTIGPGITTPNYIPQWNATANSKTLVNGIDSTTLATLNGNQAITNKTLDFSLNTLTNAPYAIAPSVTTASYIPQWNATANSKTLVNGIDSATLDTLTGANTLTNKTITSTTNTVACKSLLSATTNIDIYASAAPTVGQTLVATSGNAATWQTPAAGGGSGGSTIYKALTISRSNYVNSNIARAYTTTNLTNIGNSSITLVPLNLKSYDNNTNYNTTTYRYVAPVSGYYNVFANVGFTSVTGNSQYQGVVQKNATTSISSFIGICSTDTATGISATINDNVFLAANDYIDLRVNQQSGTSTVAVIGTEKDTFLSLYLISTSTLLTASPSGSTIPLTINNVYNPYIARMYLLGNTGSLALADNKVLFNTTNFDLNNNIVSSSYIVPVNGYYKVTFTVNIYNNGSVGNYNYSTIKVNGNGVSQIYGQNIINLKNQSFRISDYLLLTQGDKIEFYFLQADYSGININGGNELTYASCMLLSPSVASQVPSLNASVLNVVNNYICRVTKNAVQNSLPNGAWTTVQFNVISYDLSNNFNISTYRYTSSVTGYYDVIGKLGIGGCVVNKTYGIGILKNNTTLVAVNYTHSKVTNEMSVMVQDQLYLVAGDYIEIQFYNGSGNTCNLAGFNYNNFYSFCVSLITSSVITPPSLTTQTSFVIYQ